MSETSWFSRVGLPLFVVAAIVVIHGFSSPSGEPWKNNDETRHVMTGVFFRDALCDFPASAKDPKGYASRYYTQYPALGLLVWPPFFYAVEGSAMAIFGIDYVVARCVLTFFDFVAAFYLFRLTSRFAGPTVGSLSLAIAGLSLLIFEFSRYVLLEMPCLALVLGSIYHFERTLAEYRFRDAVLACLLAAFAALTRFDGIVLLPYVVIRLVMTRNFRVLLKPGVIFGIVLALLLTVPYYLFTLKEYSTGLAVAGGSGTSAATTKSTILDKLVAYPSFILDQVGWAATLWFLVGLPLAAYRRHTAFGMGVSILAATYITFTPLAELEPRHAIYWVPAITLFAALGLMEFWRAAGPRLGFCAVVLAIVGTGFQSTWEPGWYVRGYEEAAVYALEHRTVDRPILMDGVLNGGFIYQVRRHDPARKVQVVRGDKLIYAVLSDPHAGYQEFAATDEEMLAKLHAIDPELIVVEFPQLFELKVPAADRFRELLQKHPERFRLERRILFDSNHDAFLHFGLLVFRKLDRNPNPEPMDSLPVLGLGRNVSTK